MALRAPRGATDRPRHRVTIRLPSSEAAAEVVACAGEMLRIGDGGEGDTEVVGLELHGQTLVSTAVLPDPRRVRVGHPVLVSWTELNDWASVPAEVELHDAQGLSVVCEWPPRRVQRREFRRFPMEVPVWLVHGVLDPVVVEGRTRDLSGGGLAAAVPSHGCTVGDRVVAQIRIEDRDVFAAASVQWTRPTNGLLALAFDLVAPPDQDHLIKLVARAETRRGW